MITITQCLFCGSDNSKHITSHGDNFDGESVRLCMDCGLGYLSPRMSDEELKEYYASDNFSIDFRKNVRPDSKKVGFDLKRASKRWDVINSFLPESGRLLDIGGSWGSFVSIASDKFEAWSIDPSSGYSEYAKQQGFNAISGQFPEDLPDHRQYDVITMFHVLEHVPEPIEFLGHIYEHLVDGGIFVLEFPDLSKAAKRPFLGDTYFQRSHLYDYSANNLAPVLTGIGFSVDYIASYGESFPEDKNVMLICTKKEPEIEYSVNSEFAEELYKILLSRITPFYISKKSPIKIMHLASHKINVGDGAISAGIRHVASGVTNAATDYFGADIVDFRYADGAEINVDYINSNKPDLVFFGGGGGIDGHNNHALSGTAYNISPEGMERIKAPVAVVALGHNVFPGQEAFNMDKLNDFVLYFQSRGYPFSVRRDGSKDRLAKENISRQALDYIREVADPGFFVPIDKNHVSLTSDDFFQRGTVILQIAPDGYSNRFGGKEHAKDNIERFFSTIVNFIHGVADNDDATIVLATHTTDDLWAVISLLKHIRMDVARFNVRVTGVASPLNAAQFFKTYADADMVIGMRGHSVICGTGLRTPTIALSTHDKISGYMDAIDCSDWCLNPLLDDFEYQMLDPGGAVANLLAQKKEQRNRIDTATLMWRKELSQFFYDCFSLV